MKCNSSMNKIVLPSSSPSLARILYLPCLFSSEVHLLFYHFQPKPFMWSRFVRGNKNCGKQIYNKRAKCLARLKCTFFFLSSSSLASKNCCGTPLAFFCALRRSDQSSFINFPVFFSINPVICIWTSFPLTSCITTMDMTNTWVTVNISQPHRI